MSPNRAATRDHALTKYLQLLPAASSDDQAHHMNVASCLYIPPDDPLHDGLAAYVELLKFRLSAQGAFAVLLDDDTSYLLASTPDPNLNERTNAEPSAAITNWLGIDEASCQQWVNIFRRTIDRTTSTSSKDTIFTLTSSIEDDSTSKLPSFRHDLHPTFYAGASLVSEEGEPIGVVFVVDVSDRKFLSDEHETTLTAMTERCMRLLEAAQQSAVQQRWKRMNDQLTRFVGSHTIKEQQLEEPVILGKTYQELRRKVQMQEIEALAAVHGHDSQTPIHIKEPDENFKEGAESERLLKAKIEKAQRIEGDDEKADAKTFTAQANDDKKRGNDFRETGYRKIFRRAAECLREAVRADGVVFTNGITGHRGIIQPVLEAEDELQLELNQRPQRDAFLEQCAGDSASLVHNDATTEDASLQAPDSTKGLQSVTSRTYTSPEYQRGLRLEHPCEIIGLSVRDTSLMPETEPLTKSTIGLSKLDKGRLQRLMDRHPDGSVWYFHKVTHTGHEIKNDALLEANSQEAILTFQSTFPNVCQVIFAPLTDPVSLKQLAGCFVWSTRKFPLLSDTTDLPSLRGFLHILESEVSRIDALTAVKQREAFVSSVSHELRTPLHGILGSVQLLADTALDPFQTGLADAIKLSGTLLNETLTSVLSYARINQFERQQHKYRQRRSPDRDWSLPNKTHLPSGPDVDFKGLYTCTNLALLCEEIAGVLEAGQAYDQLPPLHDVTVALEIEHHDNWNFYTEPGALRRIALNLIGNALKYTTEGSVRIMLKAEQIVSEETKIGGDNASRRLITLSIKDTGKGISKDFMENHLFVPFTQEDTTSSKGVGLGMSIVKSLVSLLAGEISICSKLGEGTEVTVTVPMRLYESERSDNEKPALEFEQSIASLRNDDLSVIFFGFPSIIRGTLEIYLREWFHCTILDSTDVARPNIILVDEENVEVAAAVERTAQHYGRSGVLLSIALVAGTLSKPMRPIAGYRKWERIPRPIGPSSLGKALTACMVKLRELREEETNGQLHRNEDSLGILPLSDEQANTKTLADNEDGAASSTLEERKQTDTILPDRTRPGDSVPAEPRAPDASVESPHLHILVVEDNAVNWRLLGAFLKKYGCLDVQFAENGALAVEAVEGRAEKFDVIFMDLSMPVMDGFTATREIRRLEREKSAASPSVEVAPTYIIALTGLASDRDEHEALAAGVDVFVTKPVQFKQLSKLLREQEKTSLGDR